MNDYTGDDEDTEPRNTSCSGDGFASCTACLDGEPDCEACNGEGLVECQGCAACLGDDMDPVDVQVGPEPEPESD